MASYPPPYPPPAGGPFPFDAKQQARFAREQIKGQRQVQRAAFKAQAYAYRQQSRALRRNSILGPLLVISVGVVLLLIRLGRLPYDRFAGWYLRWWPMLLVAAGVVLALEWAFDQVPREGGVPYVRRGIGGAGVVLVLVLALTGAWAAHPDGQYVLQHGLSINPNNFGEFFGEKHQITRQIDQDFAPGTALVIDNPHGDVTIVGKSEDGKLHMTITKAVWTGSDESADSRAESLDPRLTLLGSTLNVSVPAVQGATTDLSIVVPDSNAITVNANHGGINVSQVAGRVTLTANHGDVELSSIGGSIDAHMNHRDSSFTAHGVKGDVTVRGHAQDVNVTDATGQVSLEGEFFGETHLQHLEGPINFHTSRTQLSLMKLDGEIDISPSSELTGNQIVGPTILRTSSRNISLDRMVGSVEVTNSKGSVDLTHCLPVGNVMIENREGAVNLTLPEGAGVMFDAETRGGEIENDFGLSAAKQNERTSLHGVVGDGAARVMIRTNHFDVEIHKSNVELPVAIPSVSPKPPSVPTTPSKTSRQHDKHVLAT